MGRAAVSAEIARLDAASRERPLSERESEHLAKLIVVERRYEYSRHHRVKKGGRPSPAALPDSDAPERETGAEHSCRPSEIPLAAPLQHQQPE